MSLLVADWLEANNLITTNQIVEAAINYDYIATAAYILFTDPPDVFGESGALWRFRQRQTTLEQLNDIERAYSNNQEMRDDLIEKAIRILSERKALDLSQDTLVPISRPVLMNKIKTDGIALESALKPLDEDYVICHSSVLLRIAPHLTSLYIYYNFAKLKADCDNSAFWQCGKKAALNPGNLAMGLCLFSANIGSHAVFLACCTDGYFVVENDGSVYEATPDYWNRVNVQINLFVI